jgi:hypothetical protein
MSWQAGHPYMSNFAHTNGELYTLAHNYRADEHLLMPAAASAHSPTSSHDRSSSQSGIDMQQHKASSEPVATIGGKVVKHKIRRVKGKARAY